MHVQVVAYADRMLVAGHEEGLGVLSRSTRHSILYVSIKTMPLLHKDVIVSAYIYMTSSLPLGKNPGYNTCTDGIESV